MTDTNEPTSIVVPKINFYETKITDISALLTSYIKEAGGYSTPLGAKFGHLLHEINGAFGSIHTMIALMEIRVANIEAEAIKSVPLSDRYGMLAVIRDNLNPQLDRYAEPTEQELALLEGIIKEGWRSPKQISDLAKDK